MPDYQIPSTYAHFETEIKKSRFIGQAQPVESKHDALQFINSIKEQHSSATHNCWAYIIGNPNGSHLGMSDDGEPQGTAGRPMLSFLQHAKIGNIAAVVTRYSSGIKLGTGGLVRAYTSTIQETTANAHIQPFIKYNSFSVTVTYPYEEKIKSITQQHHGLINSVVYSDSVLFNLSFSDSISNQVSQQIISETNGTALLQ